MSSQFEHAPQTGVDPSLQQGNAPSPEEAARLIDEFWQDDPTGIWQPYLDATKASLAAGNAVTMLSGAHGSGKSMLYGMDLQNGEVGARFIAEIYVGDTYFKGNETVVVLDEVTTTSPAYYADYIDYGITHGKQFVCITPGPNQETRKKMVDANTDALAERGIEVNFLGDVHDVHISAERATELLTALGVSQDVIQRFEEIPALRSPRLFALLTDSYFYSDNRDGMDLDSLQETLTQLIEGCDWDSATQHTLSIATSILTSYRPGHPIKPHAIFTSNNLSTADCIQLYEALGEPLPTATDFSSEEFFEYSYHKD